MYSGNSFFLTVTAIHSDSVASVLLWRQKHFLFAAIAIGCRAVSILRRILRQERVMACEMKLKVSVRDAEVRCFLQKRYHVHWHKHSAFVLHQILGVEQIALVYPVMVFNAKGIKRSVPVVA